VEIILVITIIVFAVVIFFLRKKSFSQQGNDVQTIAMQQHIESLRTEFQRSLSVTSDTLTQSLHNTTQVVQQHLSNIVTQLNYTTQNVNQQLSSVTQQMQTQTGAIGNRLDNAAKVIGEVQKNLGELGKIATDMKEVGQNVTTLNDLLRAPKFRGGFGETMLEDMLKQILPHQHYDVQYRFKNGQIVDAIIHTAGGSVPIDSKFPLENFRKFTSSETEAEKKSYRKQFISDVKKHIDIIKSKYILPDEGTLNFALMYIPAENVYYETIIKEEENSTESLLMYAAKQYVIPVSPNSLYAYLQVIAFGLKGLQIEKATKQILENITRLGGEFGKVRESFDLVGKHLNNARNNFDETDKKLRNAESKLSEITSLSSGEETKLLK